MMIIVATSKSNNLYTNEEITTIPLITYLDLELQSTIIGLMTFNPRLFFYGRAFWLKNNYLKIV